MRPRLDTATRWVYPPLDAEITAVGLEEVDTYVLHLYNTIAQYIATRPILEICLAAERQPGVQVTRKWWEHAGLTFGHEARMVGGGTGEL